VSILAIDPGTSQSAYCIYSDNPPKIGPFGKLPNEDILKLALLHESECAVEMIASYGMPVGEEVFETVLWIGRLIQIRKPNVTRLIYRRDVKLHLCQHSRANDSSIRQRLIDLFGKPGTKKNPGLTYGMKADIWQAFALAVTAAQTRVGEIR
jgi:hypothetical protein